MRLVAIRRSPNITNLHANGGFLTTDCVEVCSPTHVERLTTGAIRSQGIGVKHTIDKDKLANSSGSIREQLNRKRYEIPIRTRHDCKKAEPRRSGEGCRDDDPLGG